jgi:exodeoxyribonuclease V alpha subunit
MSNITGKIKKIIYQNNDNNYIVALFRVKEETEEKKHENKTINITGTFFDLKLDALINLEGEFIFNQKYSREQFNVTKYNYIIPSSLENIEDFLASSFIEGCGKGTAKKIVEKFKEKTLDIIKENKDNLMQVEGMTEKRRDKIYNSLINYGKNDDLIINMQNMGFSLDDAGKILTKFKMNTSEILDTDFYKISEILDFNKVDHIYLQKHEQDSIERKIACVYETIKNIANITGNTYTNTEEIINGLNSFFKLYCTKEELDNIINKLIDKEYIVIEDDNIYLEELFLAELDTSHDLKILNECNTIKIKDFDEKIDIIQKELNISYDDIQIHAIKNALESNVSIISGGPGTGKTTIIKAIVKLYINNFKLTPIEIIENIALLAPTGRASKKLSQATGLPAYTIHRYLKWHKESNEFLFNENNKTMHKFIIVDEASMIDISLFSSLLKGISPSCKLLLVGDAFQLPSVGPGNVLNDLISTDLFSYIPLNKIYRQSDNSFIPYLAKEIKNHELEEDFLSKKDDYNFIQKDSISLCASLIEIINMAKKKGLDETNIQVLVPIYKGENGIDNLNIILRDLFNPKKKDREEIKFGDITYREGDKVLQLVNDPDNNVFNGDIGFIEDIYYSSKPRLKEFISINFDGNSVTYTKKNLNNIKHAYVISVHKSQGSEFDHVIMPIAKEYYHMLYNKLIYTAVSRAKKSLTIVGDPKVFFQGVNYDFAGDRKTTLQIRIKNNY